MGYLLYWIKIANDPEIKSQADHAAMKDIIRSEEYYPQRHDAREEFICDKKLEEVFLLEACKQCELCGSVREPRRVS